MKPMTIETVIQEDPLFWDKNASYRRLTGGLVNQSYRVQVGNQTYYVRIHGGQADYLGLDRGLEMEACKQAGELSVSPAVYGGDKEKGYLVTEYFDGTLLDETNIHHASMMERYIPLVKTIHENIRVQREFSPFDLIERYLRWATDFQVKLPDGMDTILKNVEKIRRQRSMDRAHTHVFCHNDIWKNNIMVKGDRMVVFDWELCGYGDAYFDLAKIAYLENTTREEEQRMLTLYFGYLEPEMELALSQMKYVGMVGEAAWAFFHAGCKEESHDQNFPYLDFAHFVISQLQAGKNHL